MVSTAGKWLVIVAVLVSATALHAGEPEVGSRPAVLEQKLRLVERLVETARPEDTAAARAAVALARQAASTGDLDKAEQLALQAQREATEAYRAARSGRVAEHQRDRYFRRRSEVESFAKAYRAMLAAEGGSAVAREDEVAASELVRRAEARAGAQDFASADALLTAAYERLVLGFKREKDQQTVEYRLTFATAEEEYRYEIRRYGTYKLLLDGRLARGGLPESDATALADAGDEAERQAARAKQQARVGDFAAALRDHERATEQLITALRRSGMMLP
jgi:hypothetical protein